VQILGYQLHFLHQSTQELLAVSLATLPKQFVRLTSVVDCRRSWTARRMFSIFMSMVAIRSPALGLKSVDASPVFRHGGLDTAAPTTCDTSGLAG